MKRDLSTCLVLFTAATLAFAIAVAGCAPDDGPKEGDRIPNVPPPPTDPETGGRRGPGNSRDFTVPPKDASISRTDPVRIV